MKKLKGNQLEFISWILRDGSGTDPVEDTEHLQNETFTINCLSMTKKTYIASGFNSFVVKIIEIDLWECCNRCVETSFCPNCGKQKDKS